MKKNTFAFIMLVALSLITANADIKTKTGDFPEKQMKSQNKVIVKMVVEEISRKLPQTVDKYTKFTKISNKDLTLIYTFEIDTGDKNDVDIIKQSEDRMRKVVKKGICQSSSRFLNSNINISYVYLNANTKTKLFQFDVTKRDCQKFK